MPLLLAAGRPYSRGPPRWLANRGAALPRCQLVANGGDRDAQRSFLVGAPDLRAAGLELRQDVLARVPIAVARPDADHRHTRRDSTQEVGLAGGPAVMRDLQEACAKTLGMGQHGLLRRMLGVTGQQRGSASP
jgi:hypothetical protein